MLIWVHKRRQLGLILATFVTLLTLFTITTQSNASSTTSTIAAISDDQQTNQTNRFPKQTNQQQQQRRQLNNRSNINEQTNNYNTVTANNENFSYHNSNSNNSNNNNHLHHSHHQKNQNHRHHQQQIQTTTSHQLKQNQREISCEELNLIVSAQISPILNLNFNANKFIECQRIDPTLASRSSPAAMLAKTSTSSSPSSSSFSSFQTSTEKPIIASLLPSVAANSAAAAADLSPPGLSSPGALPSNGFSESTNGTKVENFHRNQTKFQMESQNQQQHHQRHQRQRQRHSSGAEFNVGSVEIAATPSALVSTTITTTTTTTTATIDIQTGAKHQEQQMHFGAKVAISVLMATIILIASATLVDLNQKNSTNDICYSEATSLSRQPSSTKRTNHSLYSVANFQQQHQSQLRDQRSPSLSSSSSSSIFCSSANSVASACIPILGGGHQRCTSSVVSRKQQLAAYQKHHQQQQAEQIKALSGSKNQRSSRNAWYKFSSKRRINLHEQYEQNLNISLSIPQHQVETLPAEVSNTTATNSEQQQQDEKELANNIQQREKNLLESVMKAERWQPCNNSQLEDGADTTSTEASSTDDEKRLRWLNRRLIKQLFLAFSLRHSASLIFHQSDNGSNNRTGCDIKVVNAENQQQILTNKQHNNLTTAAATTTELGQSGETAESIDSLHGLKFLSMIWIIVVHSYSLATRWSFFTDNSTPTNIYTSVASQLLSNGTFACDSFFFTGGFLSAYLAFPSLSSYIAVVNDSSKVRDGSSSSSKQASGCSGCACEVQEATPFNQPPSSPSSNNNTCCCCSACCRQAHVKSDSPTASASPSPLASPSTSARSPSTCSRTANSLNQQLVVVMAPHKNQENNNNNNHQESAIQQQQYQHQQQQQQQVLVNFISNNSNRDNQNTVNISSNNSKSTTTTARDYNFDSNSQSDHPLNTNEFTFKRLICNLLHRYIRMMPLMMAIIGFSATLLRYLGEGPAWDNSTIMFDKWCRKNWWINSLFLHNFLNRENMCLSHSWYSAVDIQLYLIGQMILFVLYRNRKIGLLICCALSIVAPLITAILTLIYNLPAVPLTISSVSEQSLNIYYGEIYIKPYCRAAPYLIGILLAYLMRTTSLGQARLKKWQVITGWTLSLCVFLAILLAMQPAMNGQPPSKLVSALYSALSRPLWACATGWMIFACITKHGGIFDTILSAKCFVPFSRLTYPAFLIHPIVMAIFYGSRPERSHFSHYLMLYLILGHIVITYSSAFILSALFELPLLSVERVIKRALSCK